jgi:hypothetical protein
VKETALSSRLFVLPKDAVQDGLLPSVHQKQRVVEVDLTKLTRELEGFGDWIINEDVMVETDDRLLITGREDFVASKLEPVDDFHREPWFFDIAKQAGGLNPFK